MFFLNKKDRRILQTCDSQIEGRLYSFDIFSVDRNFLIREME